MIIDVNGNITDLIDFRQSKRLIMASEDIHKYCSDLLHFVISISIQAQATSLKEAEEMMVASAKAVIIAYNPNAKVRMGMNQWNKIFNGIGIFESKTKDDENRC